MNVTCVGLEPDGRMRPETEATAIAGWRAGAGPYWFQISDARPEEVSGWLSDLGLGAELMDLLHLTEQETRILPLADAVFLSYPVLQREDAEKPAHFACLCLERLVVTLHAESDRSSLVGDAPVTRLKLREGTTSGVVCALALVQSARLRRRIVALRAEGDMLADRMDVDGWSVPLKEILALKRRVLAFAAVVDEELAVFEVLRASNLPVLSLSRLADAFQVAIEVTRATDRDIDRLDHRTGDLQHRHESMEQERTNRRLGLLTVISAIFMPLTLIAGIYGMNFEGMPELHYRYAYPVCLGAMAVIAATLGWYFKTRWWKK